MIDTINNPVRAELVLQVIDLGIVGEVELPVTDNSMPIIPSVGDELYFAGIGYKVDRVLWIYDLNETRVRVMATRV